MPDPGKRTTRSNNPTTPEDFPTTSPPPSGDYSYTVEIVMKMQLAMGKLTEAVESLKVDSREHRDELGKISKDIHAAKIVFGIVGAALTAAFAFLGWAITTYLTYKK